MASNRAEVGGMVASLTGFPYLNHCTKIEMKTMASIAKKFKLEPRSTPKSTAKAPAPTKVTEDECVVLGVTMEKGREFQIHGSNERFTFLSYQIPPDGGEPWVNAKDKRSASRSFYLSRIRKVIPLPKQRKQT